MSDEPPSSLPPGTIIGERYRIDSLLGEGGMGKVYAAEHVHIHRQVAIKVLHAEMSSTPEYVARFEREAVAAAKISHPNVAAAIDFGRLENHSFYIVLEYVAGTDLRTMLAEGGALPKERAIRIVRQIAAAVGAAHAAGIIHRDLKPENVMVVDHEGDPDAVKVLDFGIAKIDAFASPGQPPSSSSSPSVSQPLTKIGAVFGTPDYMSPEQALGQAVDGRSDLYSIGVIFHELLTGERLFKGGAVTLMRSHVLEAAPALPPSIRQSVGPRLEAILKKLLEKAPADRYASAAELLRALDDLTTDRAVEESPAMAKTLASVQAEEEAEDAQPRTARVASVPSQSASLPGEPEAPAVPKKRGRLGGMLLAFIALGFGALYFLVPQTETFVESLLGNVPTASAAASAAESAAAPGSSVPSSSSSVDNGDPIGPVAQASTSPDPAASPATTDSATADSATVDGASVGTLPSAIVGPTRPSASTSAAPRPTSTHPTTHPTATGSHKASKPPSPKHT
jgi:serine/threonine-protein kinase